MRLLRVRVVECGVFDVLVPEAANVANAGDAGFDEDMQWRCATLPQPLNAFDPTALERNARIAMFCIDRNNTFKPWVGAAIGDY